MKWNFGRSLDAGHSGAPVALVACKDLQEAYEVAKDRVEIDIKLQLLELGPLKEVEVRGGLLKKLIHMQVTDGKMVVGCSLWEPQSIRYDSLLEGAMRSDTEFPFLEFKRLERVRVTASPKAIFRFQSVRATTLSLAGQAPLRLRPSLRYVVQDFRQLSEPGVQAVILCTVESMGEVRFSKAGFGMRSATLCDGRGHAVEAVLHGTAADESYQVGQRLMIYHGSVQRALDLEESGAVWVYSDHHIVKLNIVKKPTIVARVEIH